MTEITREQIEAWRDLSSGFESVKVKSWFFKDLCTLALSGLDAQKRIEELEEALRPFAREGNRCADQARDNHEAGEVGLTVLVGDLREAARALKKEPHP